MGNAYDKVLNRLCMYRHRRKMNQETVGQIMGITQSHYSKLENGKKIISGAELRSLDQHGFDVDYLVTGKETIKTILDDMLEECEEESRADLMELMIWAIGQGMHKAGNEVPEGAFLEFEREIELVRYKSSSRIEEGKGLWYKVRMCNEMTQNEMADMLDINIKRYREIERGNVLVNTDLLTTLYENMRYRPSVMFEGKLERPGSLNQYFSELPVNIQKQVADFIIRGKELMEKEKTELDVKSGCPKSR